MNDDSQPPLSPESEGIRLVPLEEEDYGSLRSFAEPIWREAYREIITDAQIDYMMDLGYTPEKIRSEIEQDGVDYLWITDGGTRIGFLAVDRPEPAGSSFLHKFYLVTKRQGDGTAGRAMILLQEHLHHHGAASIDLRVNRNNARAIRFYRKSGFSISGEDCLDIGCGFVMDDYLMRCLLGEGALFGGDADVPPTE